MAAQVDLNPHQVDAALFACRNLLSKGVILADEVGLGKTIEAGLVTTATGQALHPEDAEKLLRLPATEASIPAPVATAALTEALQTRRRQALLAETQQRNLGHFEQEVQKLDDWADDLKLVWKKPSRKPTAKSRKCAAAPPTPPNWKKNCTGKNSNANWKPNAVD